MLTENVDEVMKSPLVRATANMEGDFMRRGGTPERVEFENTITDEAKEEDQLSEIDEDEWTDHNFGNSVMTSSDEASSFDDDSWYVK